MDWRKPDIPAKYRKLYEQGRARTAKAAIRCYCLMRVQWEPTEDGHTPWAGSPVGGFERGVDPSQEEKARCSGQGQLEEEKFFGEGGRFPAACGRGVRAAARKSLLEGGVDLGRVQPVLEQALAHRPLGMAAQVPTQIGDQFRIGHYLPQASLMKRSLPEPER